MTDILITGASRGIGLALVAEALARGDKVIATVRSPSKATGLTALKAGGKSLEILPLDVLDEASFAALAKSLDGRPLDIVIANAGVYRGRGGLEGADNSSDAWSEVLMTNIAGPFYTARALVPNLKKSTSGKLAIISSIMGSSGKAGGGNYVYRASKAGASNLAANLAVDLKPSGIAVGSYHPGWVKTDMGGAAAAVEPSESARGLLKRIDALSLKTTGVFEDYAGAPMPF